MSLEPAVVAVAVAAAVLVIVAGPVQRLESGLPPLKEMGATSQCNKSSTHISHFFVSFLTGLCVVSHRHQHLERIYAIACVLIKRACAKVETDRLITRIFGHSGGLHDWYLLLLLPPEIPLRRALRSRGESTRCSHYSTSTLLLRPSLHRGMRCRGSSRSSCCWLDLMLLHRPSSLVPSLLLGRSCCCCCCCLTADRGGEGSLLEDGQPF